MPLNAMRTPSAMHTAKHQRQLISNCLRHHGTRSLDIPTFRRGYIISLVVSHIRTVANSTCQMASLTWISVYLSNVLIIHACMVVRTPT
jgi:hypothetical protein